jgi:hypothetical protein
LTRAPARRRRNRAFYKGSYEELLASKASMNFSVQFGAGTPIHASGHFRGVSSFRDCASRKSLTVKLSGSRARRLQPSSATDRIFFISMCADDHYVKTQLVNTLAAHVGVYRVPQRYVRLLVSHANATVENVGVYLLLEDPDVTFAKGAAALASVVRRRSDPDRDAEPDKGTPFVKLPQDSDDAPALHTPAAAAALARYDGMVAAGASCDGNGTACYDALLSRMDVDMYLRWIAFCNFVGVRCGACCKRPRDNMRCESFSCALFRVRSSATTLTRSFSTQARNCPTLGIGTSTPGTVRARARVGQHMRVYPLILPHLVRS